MGQALNSGKEWDVATQPITTVGDGLQPWEPVHMTRVEQYPGGDSFVSYCCLALAPRQHFESCPVRVMPSMFCSPG